MPDLTTYTAVKNWLALDPNNTDADGDLQTLVTATSNDFLRAIDRTDLLSAQYTEIREGDGGSWLVTRHWPITAVSALTVAGTSVAASTAPGDGGWYFDASLDPERVNLLYLASGTFTDAARIALTYTAGYATPPADIAQAVLEWVVDRYKGRPGSNMVSSRAAGGEHVAYEKEDAMPPITAAVIERYKRTWPNLDRRNEDRNYRITRINRTYTENVS